jgi:hypothetical protein
LVNSTKIKHEIVTLVSIMIFFGCWIAVLEALKHLVLAEHQISFNGFSMVLIGSLILAKVVMVLEYVPLGAWVRARPAWVDLMLRTALYGFGVIIVLLLEKGFEGRHEYGGFGASLAAVFQHENINHVWANSIALLGALLVFNALSVIRGHLGKGGLRRLFLIPPPKAEEEA